MSEVVKLNEISVDELIAKCNAPTVRECVAKILMLQNFEIRLMLNEVEMRPDSRFSETLINALLIVNYMAHDYHISKIFMERPRFK